MNKVLRAAIVLSSAWLAIGLISKPAFALDGIRVALVQYPLEGKLSYENFIKKVGKWVADAATQKAGLVVFPELFVSDMVDPAESVESLTVQYRRMATEQTPKFFKDVSALSQKHKIAIVAGSAPNLRGGQIYNTAFVALPDGREFFQEKNFLTPDEVVWGWRGGSEVKVMDLPWGKSAVLICYDAEFPVVSNALADQRLEMLIVPSMTDTVEGFRRVRWSAQARAIEHRAYVLHTGTVGNWDPSWPNYGQASMLTPSEAGFPGLQSEGEANKGKMLIVDADLKKLRDARAKKGGIDPARDQTQASKKITVKKL